MFPERIGSPGVVADLDREGVLALAGTLNLLAVARDQRDRIIPGRERCAGGLFHRRDDRECLRGPVVCRADGRNRRWDVPGPG